MSRRDTIIIAVLLNAGLLIVLFATSLKPDALTSEVQAIVAAPQKVEEATIAPPTIVSAPNAAQMKTPSVGDEVTRAMEQYSPPLLTSTPDTHSSQLNFAADLQSIAGETPVQTSEQAAAPIVAPQTLVSFKEVSVKKGDVLERIARRNHVSVEDIMKANNLTSARLKIGQVLKIPVKGQSLLASAAAPQAEESSSKYYTVKNGDNPWTIAVKNRMKVEELLRLNNLDEEKARRLKPGDKIRIQ